MKICTRCLLKKDLSCYHKSYGFPRQPCKSCRSIEAKEQRPLIRERLNLNAKKYYQNNIESIRSKHRVYAKTHRVIVNRAINKYRLAHPERYKASQKDYLKRNRHRFTAWENKRRAMILQATPKWMNEGLLKTMELYYMFRPKGYEVDHIVPIQGKLARGLHVPWNLQYLPMSENRSKKNKFVPQVINYVGGVPSPRI